MEIMFFYYYLFGAGWGEKHVKFLGRKQRCWGYLATTSRKK